MALNFSIYSPTPRPTCWFRALPRLVLMISVWCGGSAPVRANVYPTNVRLNGGTTHLAVPAGTSVSINYLLNEPASAGVTITIKSGTDTVRSLNLDGGAAGTRRGTNAVVWNGQDDSSNNVPPGNYAVYITAATSGYTEWVQISDDAAEGNYAYLPMGIAVNRNANSPYYGRVFVANASEPPDGVSLPGDNLGLLKANADGSAAAEGLFSSGGWAWAGGSYSPWKIEVSADDFTYVNDGAGNVSLLRFDQTLAPGSRTLVLREDNRPDGGQAILAGPAIVGTGTNTQVWMADLRTNGVGIRRFKVAADGTVATNDQGTTIVPTGGDSNLTYYPYDVALDGSNRIYTIQSVTNSGDAAYRVLRFPAAAESGAPVTNADWRLGSGDDELQGASGIAVDATGTNVAVAFRGGGAGVTRTGGGVRVYSASEGADVWILPPASFHDYTDVAWDNVGNLYVCDTWDSVWRTYSPPGENQATTIALASVQVLSTPPSLSGPAYAGGQFQFTLNGEANVTYLIQAATNLQSWTPVATNTAAAATRFISIPAPGTRSFYRALVGP